MDRRGTDALTVRFHTEKKGELNYEFIRRFGIADTGSKHQKPV